MNLNHKHILVTAKNLQNIPRTPEVLIDWLERLVEAVNMKILIYPQAIRCTDEGNEGTTGIVVIKTSHGSIHVWDECEVPYLKFDLYSCDDFDPQIVVHMIEEFKPTELTYLLIDRNKDELVEKYIRKENLRTRIYKFTSFSTTNGTLTKIVQKLLSIIK